MNRVHRIARGFAVALGVLLLASAAADIMGIVPHSAETPPLSHRVAKSLRVIAIGIAFVIPYRKLRGRGKRELGVVAIGITMFWAATIALSGVGGYARGDKSWHVLPVALLVVALVLVNAYVFANATRPLR